MRACLDAMEARLADLLQSGLDTGGTDAAAAFSRLAEECEACGLHTGRALMDRLARLLEGRAYALEKEDAPLLDALFEAEGYITLCRERWQETEIRRSWQRSQKKWDGTNETEGGTHR